MNTSPNMTIPNNAAVEPETEISSVKKGMGAPAESNAVPAVSSAISPFGMPPAFPLPASASLYVGELHPDVNEAILYELFNQVGPVSSVRVCRDAITRRSLGYGYVNFHNVTDGERALDALNYHPLKGHPIRIMWSQRDPSIRRSGAGNIFIKNLEKSIDNKALHDTFSAFGNILSCKVVTDEHGNSRGFGFVHFETAEAADEAIVRVNGMLLNDIQVYVGHHISRRERISKIEAAKAKFTNVYVKNLDESIDDDGLVKLFSVYGEITSALVQKEAETNKSRGFGFVNFANHDDAAKAVEALNDAEIKGKKIVVCRAQSKGEREEELRRQYEASKLERISKFQGVNLYLKNLDESVDEDELTKLFEPFGTITSLKLMKDEKGASRGFGFICFSSPEEAQKALAEINGKMIKDKPVFVAFAQRKEDRQSLLEAQYHQRLQYRQYMTQQNASAFPGMYPPMYGGRPPMMPGGMMFARRFPQGAPTPAGPNGELSAATQQPNPGMPNQRYFSQQRGMQGFRPMGRPAYPINRFPMGPPMPGFGQRRHGNFNNFSSAMPNAFRQNPQGGMNRRPYPHSEAFANQGPAAGLTAAYLASLPIEAQKQLLGERLYPLVLQKESSLPAAQKITGMLLEMDNGELLHLLESPEILTLKVAEAVSSFESMPVPPHIAEASSATETSA